MAWPCDNRAKKVMLTFFPYINICRAKKVMLTFFPYINICRAKKVILTFFPYINICSVVKIALFEQILMFSVSLSHKPPVCVDSITPQEHTTYLYLYVCISSLYYYFTCSVIRHDIVEGRRISLKTFNLIKCTEQFGCRN